MHAARIAIILCLILAIIFTDNPITREGVSQSWEGIRPGVVAVMDSLYAAFRNFVAGEEPQDGIEDDVPEMDYERVITMNQAKFSGM